jgi:pyruvate,water dikinase
MVSAIDVHAQPRPIPVPDDFPIAWSQPGDKHLFFTIDRMHFPDQMPALDASLWLLFDEGFNRAAAAYGMPIRARTRYFNTYLYQSMGPVMPPGPPPSPEEMEAMGEQAEAKIGQAVSRLGELWDGEWLPEVQQHLASLRQFDLRGVSLPELVAHLDETVTRFKRLWEIHFLQAVPMLMSMSLFDEFYRDLFGGEDGFGSFRLTQGLDNKSVEAGQALWQLSRAALAVPAVRQILEEQAAGEVVAALEQEPEGRAFLADLRAFLDEYGQRGNTFISLSEPSWIEDPTPVIKNLKDYVAQPDRDLAAEMRALAAEREVRLAEVRARLRSYPEPMRLQFEGLLKAAQTGTVLQENHNFWIDQRCTYQLRRILVEFGRRLAEAGVINERDDVFYLTFNELRETAERDMKLDRHGRVIVRQAEMAHFRTVQPPPALGSMPPGPPPDSPLVRAIGKFFGGPPQPAPEPGTLKGNAGSPGIVRGPARVVRSLVEAGKLRQGDILVTETTSPPWTPLFATAAAVVTDTGGILSHCAVVAREYRIPAVVGAVMATATIQDGQMLEVDGDTGIIRILSID